MRLRLRVAFSRLAPIGACAAVCLSLANCSSSVDPRYGVSASPRVVEDGEPVPKGGGVYRVGAPYVVAGRTYVPMADPNYQAVGLASWYGDDFHGRMTANGEVFDLNGISEHIQPCRCRVTSASAISRTAVPSSCASTIAGRFTATALSMSREKLRTFWASTPAVLPGCGSSMSGARRLKALTTEC